MISNHPSSEQFNKTPIEMDFTKPCENCKRLLTLIKEAKDADAAYWKSLEQLGKMTMDDFFKLTEARQATWERLLQEVKRNE